ncbi:MAG: hypothetical protein FWC27_01220 [Firmicutes bacterium]|nr:hypothetical protein [Bacillota bacterium]
MEFLTAKKGEGYQKEQVDAYIRELRQTYQQMYEACQMAQRQYEALEQRCGELQRSCQSLEAELLAQRQPVNPQAGMPYPGYPPYAMPGAPYGMPMPGPAPGMPMPVAMPGTPGAIPGGCY